MLKEIMQILFNDEDKKFSESKKNYEAFKLAWLTRNFEIEMYWKRATYFWAFNVSIFAGYALLLTKTSLYFEAFILTLLGIVTCFAWFLSNKGSKFWQENWENHIDTKENEYTGKLYKEVLYSNKKTSSYSVSGINLWLSFFFLTTWILISAITFIKLYNIDLIRNNESSILLALTGITIIFCFFMRLKNVSNYLTKKDHKEINKHQRTFNFKKEN